MPYACTTRSTVRDTAQKAGLLCNAPCMMTLCTNAMFPLAPQSIGAMIACGPGSTVTSSIAGTTHTLAATGCQTGRACVQQLTARSCMFLSCTLLSAHQLTETMRLTMINQHVLLRCVPRERARESAPSLSCGKPALHYVKSALQIAICNIDFAASFDAINAQIIMFNAHALCTDIKRVCEQTHLVAVLHLM